MRVVVGSRTRRTIRLGVAGLFAASGALHLARPAAYDDFLPDWAPSPAAVNGAAGVVELVCAAGLLARRRWAGPMSAATLLAVWPSNLGSRSRRAPGWPRLAPGTGRRARMPIRCP